MNRRTSTIISIIGIIIVLLALLGITYGYYVSQISGNESSKSVEVVTGDSKVKFTDLSEDNISEIIEPGYSITKTFTVENTGNISATYSIFFVDVYNDFVRTEDVVYTLYRIDNDSSFPTDYQGCIENPANEKDCKIVVNNAEFPTSIALIKGNEIIRTPEDVSRYDLVITYINQLEINQNVDQGHRFGAKVNLRSTVDDTLNPFVEGTLAYNILNNSMNNLNGTEFKEPTLQDGINYTKPAEQISDINEKILSTTQDNYGTSYYFRGNVEDNYVTFSNKCWRIVRIQGDGSIKLTLESQSVCSEDMESDFSNHFTEVWGYKTENGKYIGDYKNSTSGMKNALTTWLTETEEVNEEQVRKNITTKAESLLKTEDWCLGNITNIYAYSSPYALLGTTATENYTAGTSFYYETGRNLYGKGVTPNATLKCNGETDSSKIGALTADEVVFAGGKVGETNYSYYLQNDNYFWWTLSRSNFNGIYDCAFHVDRNGSLSDYDGVIDGSSVRPAVSLNSGVKIISGGEGTLKNPYIINEG